MADQQRQPVGQTLLPFDPEQMRINFILHGTVWKTTLSVRGSFIPYPGVSLYTGFILLYFSNNWTVPLTHEILCRHALKERPLPLLATTWCQLKEFIEPCVPRCMLVD